MSKKDAENVCFWLPNQCTSKMDVLTPHKMVVVFLIQEYMRLKKAPDSTGATEPQPPCIELTFDDRKRFCMLLLKLIQYPDMSYKDLHGLLTSPTYGLHPVHLEEFLKLMKLLKTVGIDVLFDLYNDIDKLIMDNSASFLIGIVGLHLRKVFVTMDKMNFQEVMELYQATITYYDKGTYAMELSADNDLTAHEGGDSVMQLSLYAPIEASDHGAFAAKWSVKQSELFIAQQSALLMENEVKALPPNELHKRLEEIIHDRPQYSQAYFLQYLNYLRVRDFTNAIQALHRAFDRGNSGPASGGPMPFAAETSSSKEYQYSNLNLAILHTHFGHNEQALASLRECIVMAQESGDATCLHLAHSWLSQLQGEAALLPEKTASIGTIHATSMGVLAEIRNRCLDGGEQPSRLFGLLMLTDHLNCQRSLIDLVANGAAVRAALWAAYGNYAMASLCAQILLNADLKSLDRIYNGEGIGQVLCTVVIRLAQLGEFNLAIVVLKHTKDRFPRYPHTHNWIVTDYHITIMRALYRGHWVEASNESQKLYAHDRSLALLHLAHVTLAKLDITTAKTFIRKLLAKSELEPWLRVRALLVHANTYLQSSYPSALNVLAKAQTYARDHHLAYEDALVSLHYGYVFLVRMKLPRQALGCLKACLEVILANGPIYDRARALFLFARALVEGEEEETRLQKLTGLLPTFEEAVESFEKLECYTKAKDVYIYLATTFHALGAHDERNRFSCRYRLLQEQFPTERQYLGIFL